MQGQQQQGGRGGGSRGGRGGGGRGGGGRGRGKNWHFVNNRARSRSQERNRSAGQTPSSNTTPRPSTPAGGNNDRKRKRQHRRRNDSFQEQPTQQSQQSSPKHRGMSADQAAGSQSPSSMRASGKWSDTDEDEKKDHGVRAKEVQRRNENNAEQSCVTLINPRVHCIDEQHAMSIMTLHDMIVAGAEQDILGEQDTPSLGPKDRPEFASKGGGGGGGPSPPPEEGTSLAALPAFPTLPPAHKGPTPGMVKADSEESVSSPQQTAQPFPSIRPMPLPHSDAFTHDSITTPNTLRALSGPVHQPVEPAYKGFYRDLLFDFTPDPTAMDAGAGRFSWTQTPESRNDFVDRVCKLCEDLAPVLLGESMMPTIDAPTYVFGDIHGNFNDLAFFLKSVLVFGDIHLSPCNILCLGDYVDRGPHSLECVVLLFALKLECPEKVTLLRGNHEDRVVCGDRRTYGSECFLSQCQTILGPIAGMRIFLAITKVFTYLPLAAEIVTRPSRPPRGQKPAGGGHGGVKKILCTHGGIPRFFGDPKADDMIAFLRSPEFPRLLTLFPNNPLAKQHPEDLEPHIPCNAQVMEKAWYAMFDFMWSDPTPNETKRAAEAAVSPEASPALQVNEWGFGMNNRGSNVVTFSAKAVETFLASHNYTMLFRAHQEKAHGIRLSKSQKVLTIFSSSNYLGHGNGAGCVVVSRTGEVQLIVKT